MQFFLVLPVIIFALRAVYAQLSADDVIANIQYLVTASSNLQTTVQSITFLNALVTGPQVVQEYSNIVQAIDQDTVVQSSGSPYNDSDAQAIVGELQTFVTVHQQLLSILIGKYQFLATFGYTEPVRVTLRSFKASFDAFAFGLINLIPTEAAKGTELNNALDASLTTAIQTYCAIGCVYSQ